MPFCLRMQIVEASVLQNASSRVTGTPPAHAIGHPRREGTERSGIGASRCWRAPKRRDSRAIDRFSTFKHYLLANGALLAPCRRWIGKCKWARPQNEQHQLVLRLIVTRILSACAARRFFGNTNPCTTRGALLAFGKNHLVSPQTLRGRAKTQPPGAGCPRDVRDELRSKSGVSATEY